MNPLNIYIDRLKQEDSFKLNESLPPEFLDVHEKELRFENEVHLKGEAYLADEHLIVHLHIQGLAVLPCSICNQPVKTPITIKDFYLAKPLNEIKGSVFDLTEEVRETVLLHTPLFAECNEGTCPERTHINKFLKSPATPSSTPSKPAPHFPFADLES